MKYSWIDTELLQKPGVNNKAPFECKLNMWRYSSVG